MKLFTILTMVLVFTLNSYSQHICNADHQHDVFLDSDQNRVKFAQMNARILDEIIARRSRGDETDEVRTIPTVVHVIHNGGEENISAELVGNAIMWLNEAYANSGASFNPDGTEIPIQFCLAEKDPNGEFTSGINYVQNTLTDMLVPSEDLALKDLSRWNTEEYFNIWVVKSIVREPDSPGVVGYATFPDAHGQDMDGVVIEASHFGSSIAANTVLVHESGHYLGLFHTFQGGCPNDDCLTSGDMVCDTPPDQHLFNTFCFDSTNSCDTDEDDSSSNNPFRAEALGGLGDQFDQQINYMDYSSILCFDAFTAGQAERMYAALDVRSSLFDEDKCTPPCDDPIAVDVSHSTDVINVGGSVEFLNESTNFTNQTWRVDGIVMSATSEFMFTPSVQGTYEIELELTNNSPGCYQILSYEIVVNCPVSIEILPNTVNVSEGGTVEFSVSSTGATSFEWFVDNVSVGTTEEFSYTLNEIGVSSTYVVASNGLCDVISQVWNISVGSCSSGNEHNIWHWFNPSGNFYGFDFNSSPLGFVNEDPDVSYGHCKATICDDAGNLLFVSSGVSVYDRNYDLVENGSGLFGNESSHYGTMFLKSPGNDSHYYLFTTSSQEDFSLGVRYSVIDAAANSGLGAVTAVKNVLVEVSSVEHISIVKHCNMKDKWLVFYDVTENSFKSYLTDETGVSAEAVVSPLGLELSSVASSRALKASPQGDRLIFDSHLISFNQATGEAESSLDLSEGFTEDYEVISYDFSPNGKVLYVQTGFIDIELNQYDLTLPDDLLVTPVSRIESTIQDYATDIQKGKDNIIYMDALFPGAISTISFPNLLGSSMGYTTEVYSANATVNSFGNFYHAYIAGQDLLINGDETVCSGEELEYSIYGSECINSDIDWEFSGDGEYTVNADESVSISFAETGSATLIAMTDTDCGLVTDTLHISIVDAPSFDLGPDIGYCSGDSEITLQIPEEYEFYLWSDGSTESSLTLNNPLPQTIEGRGYYQGCYSTDEIEIIGELSGLLDLGPDQTLCDGDVVILDAGPGYSDYLWQDGSTEQTFTAFLGGTYSVTVSEPCAAFDEISIDECDQSVHINSEIVLGSFDYYPNPTNDELNLKVFSDKNVTAVCQVFDVSGRKVLESNWEIKLGDNTKKMSLDFLSEGQYQLVIYMEDVVLKNPLVIMK